MQAGSDGQACASCHFVAGADTRARNQLSPGLLGGDGVFDATRTGELASVVDNDHDGRADENLFVVGLHVPAVGEQGRAAAGPPQIATFLDLEPDLPTP